MPNISGELLDGDGEPLTFGTVTLIPFGVDAQVDGQDVLLGGVDIPISELPSPLVVTAGSWTISVETTAIRTAGVLRNKKRFVTRTFDVEIDGNTTWGDIFAANLSVPPMTPSLVQEAFTARTQAQTARDEAVAARDATVEISGIEDVEGAMAVTDADAGSAFRGQTDARYGLKPSNGKRSVGKDELVLNVLDFGISTANSASQNDDGWEELSATINDAVAGASSAWTRSATVTILFPTSTDPYGFSTPLSLPSTKNVKLTTPPWGARLAWDGSGDYIIDQPQASVGKVFEIDGLVFQDGGIRISGPFRGYPHIYRCSFFSTPGPGVDFVDTSGSLVGVVGGIVEDSNFYRCAGGVWQRSDTESLTRIERNKFNAMRGSAVLLDGFGVSILDNDFQGILSTATDAAFVDLRGTNHTTGSVNLERNRFGSEEFSASGEQFQPPAAYVLTNRGSGAVYVRGNRFRTPAVQSATMADSAFRFNKQPHGWVVSDNIFEGFYTNVVREEWVSPWNDNAQGVPSVWHSNTITSQHTAPVFSHGGVLWEQRHLGQGAPVAGASLLSSVALGSTGWTRASLTGARDATGPDGDSASAWTLTRSSSSGNASTRTTVSGHGGLASFTIWLKKGTSSRVRFAFTRIADSRQFINNSTDVQLTDEWRPYTFTTYAESGSSNYQLWIYVVPAGGSNDTVYAWGPKLEASAMPRPAMPAMEMVSPDGTRYKVTVANGGTLTVTAL